MMADCTAKVFRRLFTAFLCLLAAFSCGKQEPVKPDDRPGAGVTVYGYVKADGAAVKGAVVSDGSLVTLTNGEGRYELRSDKSWGSVFVSVPSGYVPGTDGVLPQFFKRFTKPSVTAERADFELKRAGQEEYRMLVFGDLHLAKRNFCNDMEQFRKFATEVNGLVAASGVPVYALTLGDMTWDVYWKENGFGLEEYISEVQKDFNGLILWNTMGNHDNDPERSDDAPGESSYTRTLCPNHYSFNAGGVHYIVLDDIVYENKPVGDRNFSKTVSAKQTEWLKRDLQHVSKDTPVMVAMHAPLYKKDGSMAIGGFMDLINCFSGFDRVQFLTAHTHTVYNVDMLHRSIHIYENNNGAVCGSLWMTDSACKSGMNLCCDGAPGGYRILDIRNGNISWRYKGTGCAEDFQFNSYDRNQLCLSTSAYVPHASAADKKAFETSVGAWGRPSSANEVLLNVWDWDPSWEISVTENGRELPVTRLTDVKDPLYLAVYEAYEYEHGYSVSYPAGGTDHIFSVTASSPTSTLEISVTDRFGRTSTETMTRPKAFYKGVLR